MNVEAKTAIIILHPAATTETVVREVETAVTLLRKHGFTVHVAETHAYELDNGGQ